MAVLQFSDFESRLARLASEGATCDFSREAIAPVVRAEAVRCLLLGLPVRLAGEETSQEIPVIGPGLRLRGARIEGELDLQGGAARDGSAMSPLLLEQCWIEAPLDLSMARLRGLSLKASRLTHLRAKNAVIEGPVALADIATSEDPDAPSGADGRGLCWIELCGAVIQGDVDVGGARLVAPPERPDYADLNEYAQYALDLRGARLSGTLRLQVGFQAIGGVSIRLARIDGDVMASGSEFIAVEGYALDAAEVDVTGFLALGTLLPVNGDVRPFHAKGDIWLIAARIGSNLALLGADIDGEVIAVNAAVGAHGHFYESPGNDRERHRSCPFKFSLLNLYGSTFAGTLTIRPGVALAGSTRIVNLTAAQIGTLRESSGALQAAGVRLIIEGLKFDRLVSDMNDRSSCAPFKWLERVAAKHRALVKLLGSDGRGYLHRVWPVCVWSALALFVLRATGAISVGTPAAFAWATIIALLIWGIAETDLQIPVWRRRLAWLNLQYEHGAPNRETYRPEPYEQIARYLRSSGNFQDARRIASRRLTLDRKLRAPILLRPFLWLFAVFFDHGLSPIRATFVFLFCLVIGFVGVDVANKGLAIAVDEDFPAFRAAFRGLHVDPLSVPAALVVETSTVNTIAVADPRTGRENPDLPRIAKTANERTPSRELTCDGQIDPALYAIDLFIPALELHQVSRCSVSVRPDAAAWRWAKAIYSALGWVVTALTILTLSGILRRQAES